MELFNKYFVDVVKNHYFDFNGRANRPQFWYYQLFYFIIGFIVGCLDGLIFHEPILSGILSLVMLLPTLGISARRLHDLGRSGWWLLLAFIPVIGTIVLIVWFCMKGDEKANLYGAPHHAK